MKSILNFRKASHYPESIWADGVGILRKSSKFIASILLFAVILSGGMSMLATERVSAYDVLSPVCGGGQHADATICEEDKSPIKIFGSGSILSNVASLISIIVGIASVIVIIISGFTYVTSSGDPNKVKSAKDAVIFAIVGLVVAVIGQAIVIFVIGQV